MTANAMKLNLAEWTQRRNEEAAAKDGLSPRFEEVALSDGSVVWAVRYRDFLGYGRLGVYIGTMQWIDTHLILPVKGIGTRSVFLDEKLVSVAGRKIERIGA